MTLGHEETSPFTPQQAPGGSEGEVSRCGGEFRDVSGWAVAPLAGGQRQGPRGDGGEAAGGGAQDAAQHQEGLFFLTLHLCTSFGELLGLSAPEALSPIRGPQVEGPQILGLLALPPLPPVLLGWHTCCTASSISGSHEPTVFCSMARCVVPSSHCFWLCHESGCAWIDYEQWMFIGIFLLIIIIVIIVVVVVKPWTFTS